MLKQLKKTYKTQSALLNVTLIVGISRIVLSFDVLLWPSGRAGTLQREKRQRGRKGGFI